MTTCKHRFSSAVSLSEFVDYIAVSSQFIHLARNIITIFARSLDLHCFEPLWLYLSLEDVTFLGHLEVVQRSTYRLELYDLTSKHPT